MGGRQEPIAIVSAACRLPSNLRTPGALWRAFANGECGVRPIPKSRFDVAALNRGLVSAGQARVPDGGAFLDDSLVFDFDPDFFGISPREARCIDPQHRMLLELSWEAMVSAAIEPRSLAGSDTGVYVGIANSDYHRMQFRSIRSITPHSGTGTSLSLAANRISYQFDLKGPSLSIDTACSSSLVAMHLATQALCARSIDSALVGGVNLMLDPTVYVSFTLGKMLSADGLCRTFDDAASGFVRGEGAGILLLRRFDDAVRRGDPILAVIRGTAINQDGQSNGLTAPNGTAQTAVIAAALESAGIDGRDVACVEAHGTGTALGDPVEFKALQRALAQGRADNRICMIGSAKSNFGHLEAGAGILGVIKMALSIYNEKVPPTLHLEKVNRHIAAAIGPFDFPKSCLPWPDWDRYRIGGVSAFGFGGTNAHVILERRSASLGGYQDDRTDVTAKYLVPPMLDSSEPSYQRKRHLIDVPALSSWLEGRESPSFPGPASGASDQNDVVASARGGADDEILLELVWEAVSPPKGDTRGLDLLLVRDAGLRPMLQVAWRDAGRPEPLIAHVSDAKNIGDLRNATIRNEFVEDLAALIDVCVSLAGDEPLRIFDLRAVTSRPAVALPEHQALLRSEALACEELGHLLRVAGAARLPTGSSIDVLTAGTIATGGSEVARVVGSGVRGCALAASLEPPRLVRSVIDLPTTPTRRDLRLLATLGPSNLSESPILTLRDGAAMQPVLRKANPATRLSLAVHASAWYAVTGGLGSLGLEAARLLQEMGATHLALISRSGVCTSEESAGAVAALRNAGATVLQLECDVSHADQVAALMGRLHTDAIPLRGIIHCAGVTGPTLPVAQVDWTATTSVIGAKVITPLVAAELGNLDFFLAFSSIASLWGSRNLGPYIAANSMLDAAVSAIGTSVAYASVVHWGPWADGGMGAREELAKPLQASGILPLTRLRAREALSSLLWTLPARRVAVSADWKRVRQAFRSSGRSGIFRELAVVREDLHRAKEPDVSGGLGVPPDHVETLILEQLREVLGAEPLAPIDPDAGLLDLGLDSILAIELKERLELRLGIELPDTLVFEQPTVSKLIASISGNLFSASTVQTLGEMSKRVSNAQIDSRVNAILSELGRGDA